MNHLQRSAILTEKLVRLGVAPLDILFTGATGVGKSSTLNALFGVDVSKVGDTPNPETMEINSFYLDDDEYVRIWDSPGLGDTTVKDKTHIAKIRELLNRCYIPDINNRNVRYGTVDLAVVILDGGSRDLGTVRRLVVDVILPLMSSGRVIFAINKCDMLLGGRHWDNTVNVPDSALTAKISESAEVLSERIADNCGLKSIRKPVCYSAKHGYNIDGLFDEIVKAIPSTKRRAPK